LSGGLRLHPDGKNLQGVFGLHDKSKAEVFCFSLKRDGGSEVEKKLQRTCLHYLDYTDLDNFQVASGINELGIDVLLDVNGYTGEGVRNQRSVILAYTPAPIQVHFLAWVASSGAQFIQYLVCVPNVFLICSLTTQVNFLAWVASSGAQFIQYLVSDTIASPPEFQSLYSEKLLLFPYSYFPTDLRQSGGTIHLPASPEALRDERLKRGLPAEGALISGFNQLWKIDEQLFRTWLSILMATSVQQAVLWLPLFPDVARPNLDAMAQEVLGVGAAAARMVWTPLFGEDHLQVKALAALQLDTYVYCGHTSGADILWAGVPTLSLPRVKQSARVGASLLRGLNLHTTMVARNLGILFCYHCYHYLICLFVCLSSSHTELVVIIYFFSFKGL
jgi:protein O-GlcNAc transferase